MFGRVAIVGIGPGDLGQLTAAAREQIAQSEILIGAKRMLASFRSPDIETYDLINDYTAIAQLIDQNSEKTISILVSGDVGFFSAASVLRPLINVPLRLIPGVSSLQYFSACIGEDWQDMSVVSLHGRQADAIGHVLNHPKTFFLLGSDPNAAQLCGQLCHRGLGQLSAVIGERLSYPDQRITRGTVQELSAGRFDPLAVMLVHNDQLMQKFSAWRTPGLPDDFFIRGDVPMTKELVRAACLCKLRLSAHHVVYDIGAGTGSIAVECALQASFGQVYAIERSPGACSLIRQNVDKFAVQNLEVIQSEAPHGLAQLPSPDRVFIGGSGGQLAGILDEVLQQNPHCRIVINAILLESAADAVRALQQRNCQVDVVQLATSVARSVPSGSLMLAQNPVYIISGQRTDE